MYQNFFLFKRKYSVVYACYILFIYSSIADHLSCFHLSAVVNKATMTGGILLYSVSGVRSPYLVQYQQQWIIVTSLRDTMLLELIFLVVL